MIYTLMKVFDIQYATDNVKKHFFTRSNDVLTEYEVYGNNPRFEKDLPKNVDISAVIPYSDNKYMYFLKGDDPTSDWLLENGASPGETVVIKRWW